MKSAFILTFALALFASTASAQEEERAATETDSFCLYDDGAMERTGDARPCTNPEWVTASFHCDDKHAPMWMSCRLRSCIVRNGWIVYTWSGYYVSGM